MGSPTVGEIRLAGFNFAPAGWQICDGRLLPIVQFQALFALIGTTYGGDGIQTFGLPDLRSRVPIHMGNLAGGGNYFLGESAGTESVALLPTENAAHSHAAACNSGDTNPVNGPAGAVWLSYSSNQYTDQAPTAQMTPAALAPVGNGLAHENRMPFQVINFIICLEGAFPSRN